MTLDYLHDLLGRLDRSRGVSSEELDRAVKIALISIAVSLDQLVDVQSK